MKFRLLTRSEAREVPGMISPMPDSLFVVGAVDENGVAAACGVFLAVCADPIWIRPDLRNGGKMLLRLWEATREEIAKRGGSHVRVGMTDQSPGEPTESLVARMCEFAGGEEVKARFFEIPVAGV